LKNQSIGLGIGRRFDSGIGNSDTGKARFTPGESIRTIMIDHATRIFSFRVPLRLLWPYSGEIPCFSNKRIAVGCSDEVAGQ
jgi:hypothetical protein